MTIEANEPPKPYRGRMKNSRDFYSLAWRKEGGMEELKVYWVDERDFKDNPESSFDYAVVKLTAVEKYRDYWKNLYQELTEELKTNSQDFQVLKRENGNPES